MPLRNPLWLAKEVATIDQLSGDRVFLGVGVGYDESGYKALGLNFSKPCEIIDEYLQALKKLWTEPKATFHGRFTTFDDAESCPKPVQQAHPLISTQSL